MARKPRSHDLLEDDPLWYKDAIIYELHVRAFEDSNGDGIGDFRGLVRKLDYLQDLGVTAIWLLPFCPSPLRDDGYDIADFTSIHRSYGTRRDFQEFVREAHTRGLRVITELVVNHTSDQHPWFQRARRAKSGTAWREYYVWSENPEKYREARIIFKDFEPSNWTWDPVAKAYYWHRFYAHQPDLNYDNPAVCKAVMQVLEFWFDIGVDGLRLDAVPYLYEREGTNCENLPETHAFLKDLRRHVDKLFKNRMFLAEANQWPEDAAAYFGQGDECHMNFHFPLMPRLFMAMRMEDRLPIIDIMEQTPTIPESCQWAVFLRNHDELTLEMVTDEERDYMYRAFAQDREARINLGIRRRLGPLLGNDRKKIELMNSLLFSLPGTPVIYYGDEIGMGDNFYLGDRNGVRTPMQWNADRNAGFSRTNPQKLYLPVIIDPEYHYEAVNVELQQNNTQSLLWWMKRMLSLRRRSKVFGRGSLEFLHPTNRKMLAFVRRYEQESLLVVANLSRFAQGVELDLSAFKGMAPIDLFGRSRFRPIEDHPYYLTLGPHTYYWFALEPEQGGVPLKAEELKATLPDLTTTGHWTAVFRGREKTKLEALLPDYLRERRWFGGKARTIQSTEIRDLIPLPTKDPVGVIAHVQVEYAEGEPETYRLPLTFAAVDGQFKIEVPAALAHLRVKGKGKEENGLLFDATGNIAFLKVLLGVLCRPRQLTGSFGEASSNPTPAFRGLLRSGEETLEPTPMRGEQSNTSVVYGDLFIMKLYRRAESGMNPDFEIGRFLTDKGFASIAPVVSVLEHRSKETEPATVALLQSFLPNEGDAWKQTLDRLGRFYEDVLGGGPELSPADLRRPASALAGVGEPVSALAGELIGLYLDEVRLLGRRTGELHRILGSDPDDPNFAPEPFTDFYRRGLYQSMASSLSQNFALLRQRIKTLTGPVQEQARKVLDQEGMVRRLLQQIRDRRVTAMRIRCHGDYHLGQVLYTGKDFIIIDFEGEPARPLSVRRMKGSPLRDVAGMLRSFHYAAYAPLIGQIAGIRPEDFSALEPWARFWQTQVSTAFLTAYLEITKGEPFLPKTQDELDMLLEAFLLEKAVYELRYELNNRPNWVRIPLEGILHLVEKG